MKKVIVINNIISPLRVFLYNHLNEYYKKKGYAFKVIFLSETDKNRDWKREKNINFNYEVLDNFAIRTYEKDLNTFFINRKIGSVLNKEKPDKIICFGWDHFAAYASIYWCKKHKKEFILWSGSTVYEKSWRRSLTKPLVNWLIKRTDNFIAYGTKAKEYLISLGADADKIQIFYNTIDIDYFEKNSQKLTSLEKADLKKGLGIKTDKIIIFNGRLIKMKGLEEMLLGYNMYCQNDPNISLLVVGNGPDKGYMEEIINRYSIPNVFFSGFIQYKDVYKYYAISNLLLFPSRQDIWGLVINEALACGLPVITTSKVGASFDLVENGKNGFIINEKSPSEINTAIQKVFSSGLRHENNSLEIAEKVKVENILQSIKL